MRSLLLLILVATALQLPAQDVENFFTSIQERIAAKDYLRASGNLGLTTTYNTFYSEEEDARRIQAPFTWSANAGVNFDFLGIQAPFNAAFSSRNTTYNLPSYAFVGLSPTYKWITLHGGDRSMTFSPYSLSGVNYRGAGLELTPGKFRFSAMTGKLRRARIQDAGSIQNLDQQLKRRGSGFQVGYDSKQGTTISTSFFTSADEIPMTDPETDTLERERPEQNTVLTISGGHQFSDFLQFDFEVAQSVLTRDRRLLATANPDGRVKQFGLVTPNASTTASRAMKFTIGLSPKFGNLGFTYERIDPEYRTHGSLFFQNDLENFTTSFTAPLLNGKLNLSTNVGLQRNDLDGQKANNQRRFIGSVNAGVAVSDRVNTTLGISNFTATNRIKTIALASPLVDSIVLAQSQFSINSSTTFLLDPEATHVLLVMGNWQRAGLIRNEEVDTTDGSRFAMGMLNYTYQAPEGKGSFNASLIAHRNVTPGVKVTTLAPNLSYGRKIFKEKGNLTVASGYSIVTTDITDGASGVFQASLGGGYSLGKSQTINLSSTFVKVGSGGPTPAYGNFSLSLAYGYTFK